MKKTVCILLCLFLIIGLFCSCGEDDPTVNDGKDKAFKYSISANPKNLDPQVTTDNNSLIIIKNIFEGLVKTDEYGNAVPGVAISWENNDSYTQFTFHLRRDAKWSNEASVTANDFVFAFKRAVDPKTSSPTCSSLFCIKNASSINEGASALNSLGVKAKDDYTLIVDLAYPYPEFPLLTSMAQFMPCNEEYFYSTKGHYGMNDDQLICNGPFTLTEKSWVEDEQIKIFKNEYYKGEKDVYPYSVNFVIRKSKVDYLENVISGNADAAPADYTDFDRIIKSGLEYFEYSDTTWGLVFNTQDKLFSSKDIRLAFVHSINQSTFMNNLPKGMTPAYDIIPPSTHYNGSLYREIAGNGYKLKQDNDAAAGYLNNGLGSKGYKSLPKITVLCPKGNDILLTMQYLLQSWQENLKVYINIKQVDLSEIKTAIQTGDYQIALYPITPDKDGPITCLNIFRSSTYSNPAKYSDYSYDSLLEQAATATSSENAISALITAERKLNEDAVFYPMYYETSYYVLRAGVSGITFSPFDTTADFSQALRITL